MRLAVISDIHGNFRALQAVLADIDRHGVDDIVSLGDNIGYGPEPEEVVQTLIARSIVSVMGNHELALSSASYFNRLNPPTRLSLEITRNLLEESSLRFCKTLLPYFIKHQSLFVHGCPPASATTYLWRPSGTRLERIFASFSLSLCFFGHTHDLAKFAEQGTQYSIEKVSLGISNLKQGGRYLINPGSVGQPRDGINNWAKYGIWDQDGCFFEYRAVEYDVQATVELLRKRKFPASNAQRLQW